MHICSRRPWVFSRWRPKDWMVGQVLQVQPMRNVFQMLKSSLAGSNIDWLVSTSNSNSLVFLASLRSPPAEIPCNARKRLAWNSPSLRCGTSYYLANFYGCWVFVVFISYLAPPISVSEQIRLRWGSSATTFDSLDKRPIAYLRLWYLPKLLPCGFTLWPANFIFNHSGIAISNQLFDECARW